MDAVARGALGLPVGAGERVRKLVTQQAGLGLLVERAFQAAFTDVAATAFDDVEAQLGDDLGQARQVLVEQLFLQRHGGGGDDDGLVHQLRSHDGGKTVGHGLAGACACFELREIVALAGFVVWRFGT